MTDEITIYRFHVVLISIQCMISIQQQNVHVLAAAHLEASNNDERMNVELGYGQTDLLHEVIWQGSL